MFLNKIVIDLDGAIKRLAHAQVNQTPMGKHEMALCRGGEEGVLASRVYGTVFWYTIIFLCVSCQTFTPRVMVAYEGSYRLVKGRHIWFLAWVV